MRLPSRRLGFLFLIFLLLQGSNVRANIFGTDDRRLITKADGLSAVGLIVCEGTTRRPTATLVSPDTDGSRQVIISVAHSFLTNDNRPLGPCSYWPEGRPENAVRIAHALLGTGRPAGDWNEDWAVATLAHALPATYHPLRTLVMSVTDADAARASGVSFLLAGHNGETGPMMWSGHCGPVPKRNADINRFDDRAFNHDCDMMPGWSGGPLILQREGQRYVIAVNATELNALVTVAGEAYNGVYNANTAVRIDGAFLAAIKKMSTGVTLARSGEHSTLCQISQPPPLAPRPC
jgi:protease YdgD